MILLHLRILRCRCRCRSWCWYRCPTDLWMRWLQEPFRLSSFDFFFFFCLLPLYSNMERGVFKTQANKGRRDREQWN